MAVYPYYTDHQEWLRQLSVQNNLLEKNLETVIRALNEGIQQAQQTAQQALDAANKAQQTAQQALDAANKAQQTVQQAELPPPPSTPSE